jgi:hypothetical protein
MAEEHDQEDVKELRTLLERNAQAIQTLRQMIENMEVLLARLAEVKNQPGPRAKNHPELP